MSLAQVLSTYAALNILLATAFLILKFSEYVSAKFQRQSSAETELRIHYMGLGAVIAIALIHPLFPKLGVFEPAAKVWSAESITDFSVQFTSANQGGYFNLPFGSAHASLNADSVSLSLLLLSLAMLSLASARLIKDIRSLWVIRRKSYLLRRIGRVSIFANEDIAVPFSYWIPGYNDVVIPTSLIANPINYRIAVAHELQHHRQADTRWVYVMRALKFVCVLNPFIHLWNRWLSEIQEFACDEILVGRNKVESLQYARCLAEVAETALNQRYVPVCATGVTFLIEQNLLKRRVKKMMSSSIRIRKSRGWTMGGLLVGLLAATAFASTGIVQDRRVSLADAQQMATNARSGSDFPVVVNDQVLTQLNRYIGTPEGRKFMRESLLRMENYRTLVEGKTSAFQVPTELMAIPIIESGYQNLAASNAQGVGAGLWMFLAATARDYGLRVDHEVDERLNATLQTDAAMRYLKGDQLKFNDWLLSVLAYNIGEGKVLRGIRATGSRDAWVLVRNGYENDRDYLAKVMAAILIMKNPDSVD